MNHVAYPDGHPDKETDEDGELEFLKQKVDAGADFIVTQLFYDVDGFSSWIQKVREKGTLNILRARHEILKSWSGITVPIIPGIMPIQTYASFLRMTKLCGTRVPPKMMHELVPIRVWLSDYSKVLMQPADFPLPA